MVIFMSCYIKKKLTMHLLKKITYGSVKIKRNINRKKNNLLGSLPKTFHIKQSYLLAVLS